MPKKSKKLVTAAEAASLNFEPWKPTGKEPTPAQMMEVLANPVVPSVQIAWRLLCKNKGELVEFLDALDDDALKGVLNGISASKEYCQDLTKLLSVTEAHLIVAAGVIETREEAA